jgi:hypothetical protein
MGTPEKEFDRGFKMLKVSTPDGNTWPRNEEEWKKAVAAYEQMGYAMYLMCGLSKKKARLLARQTHSGAAGRLMLEMAIKESKERHG